MSYAELQVTSNFSFLRGASHPEELVLQAHALGLDAIVLTDRNTLAGVVRAHIAAKEVGIRFVVGARLDLLPERAPLPRKGGPASGPFDRPEAPPPPPAAVGGSTATGTVASLEASPGRDRPRVRLVEGDDEEGADRASAAGGGFSLLCFPTDRAAYGRLSQLISKGQRRAPKGLAALWLNDVIEHAEGQILVALPPLDLDDPGFGFFLERLRLAAPGRTYLAAHFVHRGDDRARIERLAALAEHHGTPLVATGDVLYHTPGRRPLQDVLTCIREKCTIDEAGLRLHANAERHLKPAAEIARLFRHWPDAVARTREIVRACRFSLDELAYDYPIDPPPEGLTVQRWLERLTWEGAAERYPDGVPSKVEEVLRHEFQLIEELDYAPYFLTVHDIVRFARSRDILCQGRGSAANSAVCYCLGVTAVDPSRFDLLFERFVSAERNEPPDIDVDFEHERREEVIQYIYEKYGREHAGIAATVIHYRTRSAIREVGKALGLSADVVGGLAGSIWGWSNDGVEQRDLEERGIDPDEPRVALAVRLSKELIGFPRHLSQHVGGFVLTRSRLDQVVPVLNGAMPERTFVEWDKDDLDALGILKIDVLGLGMLTCVRKSFELLERHYGKKLDLATVPAEDPAVYEMLGRGDSIGVFQVESRAQMTMLPRLKPACFYDLIVEVAIVRPGPIQGDMVHPYLRRRAGLEPVEYPSEALKGVLEKTLGVPLFQEQAMKIAIIGAGFTPSESDRLRRAMATFKRVGTIDRLGSRFIEGMVGNGYGRDFAEKCFRQIEGFGTYGFPESHAASFALLVYVSSWIKCHYPDAFAAALLNSQPMGFYAPAQIVRDAKDHGVTVLPVDVAASDWDTTLEPPAADARVSAASDASASTAPAAAVAGDSAASDGSASTGSSLNSLVEQEDSETSGASAAMEPPAADARVSAASHASAATGSSPSPLVEQEESTASDANASTAPPAAAARDSAASDASASMRSSPSPLVEQEDSETSGASAAMASRPGSLVALEPRCGQKSSQHVMPGLDPGIQRSLPPMSVVRPPGVAGSSPATTSESSGCVTAPVVRPEGSVPRRSDQTAHPDQWLGGARDLRRKESSVEVAPLGEQVLHSSLPGSTRMCPVKISETSSKHPAPDRDEVLRRAEAQSAVTDQPGSGAHARVRNDTLEVQNLVGHSAFGLVETEMHDRRQLGDGPCEPGNPRAAQDSGGRADSHHSLRHAPTLTNGGEEFVNAPPAPTSPAASDIDWDATLEPPAADARVSAASHASASMRSSPSRLVEQEDSASDANASMTPLAAVAEDAVAPDVNAPIAPLPNPVVAPDEHTPHSTRARPVKVSETSSKHPAPGPCDPGNPRAAQDSGGRADSHHSLRHAPTLTNGGEEFVNAPPAPTSPAASDIDWDATLEPPAADARVSAASHASASMRSSPSRLVEQEDSAASDASTSTAPPAADARVSAASDGSAVIPSPFVEHEDLVASGRSSSARSRPSPSVEQEEPAASEANASMAPPATDARVSAASGGPSSSLPGSILACPVQPPTHAPAPRLSGGSEHSEPSNPSEPNGTRPLTASSSDDAKLESCRRLWWESVRQPIGQAARGFPGSHGPGSGCPGMVVEGLSRTGVGPTRHSMPHDCESFASHEQDPRVECKGNSEPAGERKSEGDGEPAEDRKSEGDSEPTGDRKSEGDSEPTGERKSEGEGGPKGEGKPEDGWEPDGKPEGGGEAARPRLALRLGFRQVKGLKEEEMRRLVACRGDGYADLADLRRRARIGQGALDHLARADAFGSLTLDRRQAVWTAIGLDRTGHELDRPPLFAWADGAAAGAESAVALPAMSTGQHVAEDYRTLRLTLRTHPLALLRARLRPETVRAADLPTIDDGSWVEAAGLVLVRQRPGTASGVIFVTLEDETGVINLVVWPRVFERFRRVVLGAQMMSVAGKVQKEGLVIHVVASRLTDRTDLLRALSRAEIEAPVARGAARRGSGRKTRAEGPGFASPLARADHAKSSGGPDPRDPLWRPRDIDHYRSHPDLFPAPLARADEVERNTRNTPDEHRHPRSAGKIAGFKSRDFH